MNETIIKIDGVEAIKARHEALTNAKKTLMEAFTPAYNQMLGEKLREEEEGLTESDLDEVLSDLENECFNGPTENRKKPSFIQNMVASFYRQKPSTLRCRFQKLAGITKIEPAAKLTIGTNTFELSEIPPWYNILRYTLCGFKFEILNRD
jgi:hypothetical protein